jgi:hypothetical protein
LQPRIGPVLTMIVTQRRTDAPVKFGATPGCPPPWRS